MKKIALIDDEQMILDLYCKALKNEFDVLTANNGKEGLKLIKDEKPDLLLVDIQMPEMSGLELISCLSKENLLNIPIIILTNHAQDENVAKAIDLGAREYVLKVKITPYQLVKKVRGFFND